MNLPLPDDPEHAQRALSAAVRSSDMAARVAVGIHGMAAQI